MNGAKALIVLPIQQQTTHTTATFYTTALWCIIQHTTAYATLIEAMSLRLNNQPFDNSSPHGRKETLLHKLQSTESIPRYLQIPVYHKLSNGRFDVKHFYQNFISTSTELH